MNERELQALITLLDDEDEVVYQEVSNRLLSLGETAIPYLERAWEASLNPLVQSRIEGLIHRVQFDALKDDLRAWMEYEQDNLLRGMWLLARYQYPDLDFENLSQEFNRLYYDVWFQFRDGLHPLDQIQLLNRVFFKEWKFTGNTQNFHSPSNSMIHLVLESRKGNPLTLCALYLLVAQRLNLPVYGVNLPVVFVLLYRSQELECYINVFNQGSVFVRNDIEEYLKQLNVEPQSAFFEPCTHADIVARACRNLIFSFKELGEVQKAEEVQQLLDIIEHYK